MKDVVKGDLQVVFELAGKTEKLTSSIMEGSNGALHVGCTPKVAGARPSPHSFPQIVFSWSISCQVHSMSTSLSAA